MDKTKQCTLASSRKVLFRESTGEDDAIFSKVEDVLSGANIFNFLSAIIVTDLTLGKKPTPDDVKAWKINDRNTALIKYRIFNLGDEVTWSHACSNDKCKHHKAPFEAVEDLKLFDVDYNELDGMGETPEKEEFIKNLLPTQYPGYPNKDFALVEFEANGNKYRFKALTSALEESYSKLVDVESTNSNSMLISRELEKWDGNKWVAQRHFINTPSKEMAILRAYVKKFDSTYNPISMITCPVCKTLDTVNLLMLPDFYLPGVKI